MNKKIAFTLAEVLITLAIIGVVASMVVPSVISNSQQQEFKTGLRKAVTVLNSAITMNIALEGESPYDNANTFAYLQRHMNILKSTDFVPWKSSGKNRGANESNAAFYTADGMRFEFNDSTSPPSQDMKMHEPGAYACSRLGRPYTSAANHCGGCGSMGLAHNPNGTTKAPCIFLVDVNGDRKPTPTNINCKRGSSCPENENPYFQLDPKSSIVKDIFMIMITEDRAIPYGVVAQKAMYQAQKKR